jgi:hypothetical protein
MEPDLEYRNRGMVLRGCLVYLVCVRCKNSIHYNHQEGSMKTTFAVMFTVVAAAILTGCDPSNPMVSQEPLESVELDKVACGGEIVIVETIPLVTPGPNPLPGTEPAFIIGKSSYSLKKSLLHAREAVTASIELNAELHPPSVTDPFFPTDPVWIFSFTSTDQVILFGGGPTSLLKTYLVRGQSSDIQLFVQYEIGSCEVTIGSMWAQKILRQPPLPTDS